MTSARTREPFREVAAAIRDEISSGVLPPGSKLSTSRDLAAAHEVSVTTVVRAVALLREEGLITTVHGRGSYVSARHEYSRGDASRYEATPSGLAPNRTESAAEGYVDEIDHHESWTEPATDAVAQRLGIKAGDPVSAVRYRWIIGGTPSQVSTQWEPVDLITGTTAEEPTSSTRGGLGVIERFRRIGWDATEVSEEYRTRLPSRHEADALEVPEGQPVMVIARTHHARHTSGDERAIETADIVARGDRVVIKSRHPVRWSDQEGPLL